MQQVLYVFYHTSYNLKEGYISNATERLHNEKTGVEVLEMWEYRSMICAHV